ncbi:MAG: YitT family protein [Eubacteriales bacterium]|nr:YitT family protein [Eubacteriales bacterium]
MYSKGRYLKKFKHYGIMMFGAFILSFGLYNVHRQSQITEGGVLGLQLFLKHWFDISPSLSGLIMDLSCYTLGFSILGHTFLKNAIVSSIFFSFFYWINENVIGIVLPDFGSNPIFAAIIGGIFVGVGVGLIVNEGGASGGDDALALIISKLTGQRLSRAYFFTDFVVLMLSVSYIPLAKILCSLITVSISSFIIGKIEECSKNTKEKLVSEEK